MRISRKADYALRAVWYISSLPKGELGSISEVAEAAAIPREFLAKILKALTTSGVLQSYQGVKGGYCIAPRPREVSYLDVIEAVEGPLHINLCTEEGGVHCDRTGSCDLHHFWIAQEKSYKKALISQKFPKRANKSR